MFSHNAVFILDTFSVYFKIPPKNVAKRCIDDENAYHSNSSSASPPGAAGETSNELLDTSEDLFPDTAIFYDADTAFLLDATLLSDSDTVNEDIHLPDNKNLNPFQFLWSTIPLESLLNSATFKPPTILTGLINGKLSILYMQYILPLLHSKSCCASLRL
jgi:hypothetical protein